MAFDITQTFKDGLNLWLAGGWAMIPLALNALILYGKAAEIRLDLWRKDANNKRWDAKAAVSTGRDEREIGRDYLTSRGIFVDKDAGFAEMGAAFDELRAGELAPLIRNLKFLKVAMSAAPLWGLLGTVTGMLTTFDGLSRGGGGDKTMNMVAGGISEALITTQTGLMVALPGLFFHYYLMRRKDSYEEFLTHLESSLTRHSLMSRRRQTVDPSEMEETATVPLAMLDGAVGAAS